MGVVVEGANAKSNAEMDRIEREVAAMTEREQEYDAELAKEEQKNAAAAEDEGPTDNKVIEARINSTFTHVYDIAEKMGDADIDGLLDTKKTAAWDQILNDAESGTLPFPKAVEAMEEIITKNPAALKLAEATNALALVEQDGGTKGVTEVTNFPNLLKEVKWLPQYAAVLEEFSAWKEGKRTVEEVLVWTEQKMAAGELDGAWLAKAYEAKDVKDVPITAKATKATHGAASRSTKGRPTISHRHKGHSL